jgi:hypothetical protein
MKSNPRAVSWLCDSKDSDHDVLPTIHRTFASQIALMPVPARYSNVGS